MRRWFLKFGSTIAANLRRTRPANRSWSELRRYSGTARRMGGATTGAYFEGKVQPLKGASSASGAKL